MRLPVVVAMFGLSGVGKGWIAHKVCSRCPSVLHLEASAMLRAGLNQTSEALRTSAEDVMRENQRHLAVALAAARAAEPDRPILFDGHSVIDNDADLIDVPIGMITSLKPHHIVFVAEVGSVIARRRLEDSRRRPIRTADELERHQARARSMAESYAAALSIPCEFIRSGEWERVSRLFGSGPLDSC